MGEIGNMIVNKGIIAEDVDGIYCAPAKIKRLAYRYLIIYEKFFSSMKPKWTDWVDLPPRQFLNALKKSGNPVRLFSTQRCEKSRTKDWRKACPNP